LEYVCIILRSHFKVFTFGILLKDCCSKSKWFSSHICLQIQGSGDSLSVFLTAFCLVPGVEIMICVSQNPKRSCPEGMVFSI